MEMESSCKIIPLFLHMRSNVHIIQYLLSLDHMIDTYLHVKLKNEDNI